MRILVVANETVAAQRVVDEVAYRAGEGDAEVLVVAPALRASQLEHLAGGDEAAARARAQARLDESVTALRAAGLTARGELGDASPLQAVTDAVRLFSPDEVIISTHPPARSTWLEKRVVERARERLPMPVHHVVVDVELERAAVHADPRSRSPDEPKTLRLLHFADYEAAMTIRSSGGFPDEVDDSEGVRGVWMIAGTGGRVREDIIVFAVEAPVAEIAPFEREPGFHDERRFFLPAALLNRLGPIVALDDDTAE
jgi:hypothetical protein